MKERGARVKRRQDKALRAAQRERMMRTREK